MKLHIPSPVHFLIAFLVLFFGFTLSVTATENSFEDVPDDSPYAAPIAWAVDAGITKGATATTFSTDTFCTRAEYITFLYRAAGSPQVSSACRYADVSPQDYFYNAIRWATENGISAGTSESRFDPSGICTRAQAITFLYRAVATTESSAKVNFRDISEDAYYYAAVQWAVESGITLGTSRSTFSPDLGCTRGQCITLLYRAYVESLREIDRIHFISMGGNASEATLIESNGKYMLVDAGNPDPTVGGDYSVAYSNCNGRAVVNYLNALGLTHLDYVVLTHNHSDHLGGIPILCRTGFIDHDTIVYYRSSEKSGDSYADDAYWYLQQSLESLRAVNADMVCLAERGFTSLTVPLGDFTVEFRNLDEDNDGIVDFRYSDENRNSIVLKVTKGSVSTLLTGDLAGPEEATLLANGGVSDIDILKLAHHGNNTSNTYAWLKATNPSVAILNRRKWSTSENSGICSYAYLCSKNVPVYACDGTKTAIVFTIQDDSYTVNQISTTYTSTNAVALTQTIPDGFYYWAFSYASVNNIVKVENGMLVKDAYRSDSAGTTYYFGPDGV